MKGENLFVCFVDFAIAFDRVNRHILFYKLFKSGLHGRVMEALHNLYQNTYFRFKLTEKLVLAYSTSWEWIKEVVQATFFSVVIWQTQGNTYVATWVS